MFSDKELLNKGTVSSGSSAVLVVWTTEPVLLGTAASWTNCSITLLLGSHFDELNPNCYHGTVFFCCSTVHVIGTTEPVLLRAAATWTNSSITLLLGSHPYLM